MPSFSFLDAEADITHLLLRHPRRYRPLNEIAHQLLRGKSDFTTAQRELLAAYVSALNACAYCVGVHREVAARYGVDAATLEALTGDTDFQSLETRLRPVFGFARQLTLQPAKITKKDAEAVYAAGWSESALEDVIGIVGLFSFYNRLLDGYGISGSQDIYAAGATHLAKRGYRLPRIVAFVMKQYRSWKKAK